MPAVTDQPQNQTTEVYSSKPTEGQPWDTIIIGSGPSALTAAIYTTRGAASTLILGGAMWGGQLMLTTEVDNFPGHPKTMGPDLMKKFRDHSLMFGGELVQQDVTALNLKKSPFKLTAGNKVYKARSVIIATGSETRWLGVPGEEKLRGRGLSSCAPCDAPFFKEKEVLVIGGGDSAMEEALVLTKYASSVTMVHRRDAFRASKAMQKRVMSNAKIKVIWDTEVFEILGEDKLTGAKLKTKIGTKSAADIQGEEKDGFIYWDKPSDGVFVAVGHIPTTKLFEGQIELDEKGYIVKHDRAKSGYETATSVKGVFVAGDVHDYHYQQAITAAGFGCMAGMDTVRYLDTLSSSAPKK